MSIENHSKYKQQSQKHKMVNIFQDEFKILKIHFKKDLKP